MNIEERVALNTQKIKGIEDRINAMEREKVELLQEALRLGGENRVLVEQQEEEKKGKGE